MVKSDVVVLGDTHFPYVHKETLKLAQEFVAAYKPKFFVQVGDLYDLFHFSKYPKSMLRQLGVGSPDEEIETGRLAAEQYWKSIQKASPRTKCFQLWGNHDDRPLKRLIEKAPELEWFAKGRIQQLLNFPGVETLPSSRDHLILSIEGQKVTFEHGHRSKLGDHMLYNEMSTVCGHSHTAGLFFKKYRAETRFEFNVGYAGNPEAGPLQYGAVKKKYWTLGFGYIDRKGPLFIPSK